MGGALSAALVLALVLSGCHGESSGSSQPSDRPTDDTRLSVALDWKRSQERPRDIKISVTNHSDTNIRVVSATWRSPWLTRPAHVTEPAVVLGGTTLDLRAVAPAVACAGRDLGVIHLRYQTTDTGPIFAKTVPAKDLYGQARAFLEKQCDLVTLRKTANLAFGPLMTRGEGTDQRGFLRLRIRPTGEGRAVRLLTLEGTTAFVPPGSYLWRIDRRVGRDSSASTVLLPVEPRTCDKHLLQEAPQSGLFRLNARLADGARITPDITANVRLRGQLSHYFATTCGLPGS